MKFLLKRSSILILLALVIISVGCRKNPGGPPVVPLPTSNIPGPAQPPNVGQPPTITLRADNTAITAGQSATLTYTATNATTVRIDPGVGAVQPATGGTRQVTPTAATTYTATANGPGGTAVSAGVTITVNPVARAATPPPASTAVTPTPNRSLDVIFTQQMVPILFDYDKSNIRPGEESKLLSAAAWLKQNATLRFEIQGHADERGGQEYNIALGDERAAAVKRYLAGQGIAENRMTTASYGEERPICREQTEGCFQENRRAAFTRIP
jgi:peptidoglycan-associated lipoprotein